VSSFPARLRFFINPDVKNMPLGDAVPPPRGLIFPAPRGRPVSGNSNPEHD
jgi:hypothetical protein